MRSVTEHQRVVAELIQPRGAITVPLAEAAGLTLAEDVVAPLTLPAFDNSAMDGYAVVADDVAQASPEHPAALPVTEDIPAGRTDHLKLEPGTAHRIMTGAPVPDGATAVVPVEATDGGRHSVNVRASAKPGQHIRRAGEDVTAGMTVLRSGQLVAPAALGLAAALGLTGLKVIPRQRVLVMSTGEELVKPGQPLLPGQIYESNAVMLAAALREAGCTVVASLTSGDDVDEFRRVLDGYADDADLVVTTGGVSAGAYEVVKDALGQGGVEFVKVAMQPGMPQGAGTITDAAGGARTAIITLPGNPVSALVSFEVFVRPALRNAMALPDPHRPRRTAVLAEGLKSPLGKRQFRRGVFDPSSAGAQRPGESASAAGAERPGESASAAGAERPGESASAAGAERPGESASAAGAERPGETASGSVTTYGPPASHHLRWLASANCLLEIDENVGEMAAGDLVHVWDLR